MWLRPLESGWIQLITCSRKVIKGSWLVSPVSLLLVRLTDALCVCVCFVCFVLRLKHGGAGKWLQEVLHSLFLQTFILIISNMEICFWMSYCFINVGVAFEGWAPSNNFGQIITFCYDHSSLVACRFRHVRFKFKYPSTYTHDLLNDDLCHLVLVSSFGVNLGSCF